MRQRIEKYLQTAIEIVPQIGICNEAEAVPSQFNGYISSFGAAVVQSGLLPAVVFYSEKGRAEKERQKVTEAILAIIKTESDSDDNLYDYVRSNADNPVLVSKIMDAAAALKLAIRTYELEKQKP